MIRNWMIKKAKEGKFKDIPEQYRAQLEDQYKAKPEPKNVSEIARKEEKK